MVHIYVDIYISMNFYFMKSQKVCEHGNTCLCLAPSSMAVKCCLQLPTLAVDSDKSKHKIAFKVSQFTDINIWGGYNSSQLCSVCPQFGIKNWSDDVVFRQFWQLIEIEWFLIFPLKNSQFISSGPSTSLKAINAQIIMQFLLLFFIFPFKLYRLHSNPSY